MTQEVLKLALEELAVRFSEGWHEGIKIDASDIMLLNEAAQALAQPEQEPVAYINVEERKLEWAKPISWNTPTTVKLERIPLYTTPPQPEQEPSGHFLDFAYSDSIAYVHVYDQFRKGQQFYKAPPQRTWVGLTEEEVKHEWEVWRANIPRYAGFAKGIEAKFKQKNGYAEEKNI